jgi:DUF4097 and DUF4098 domain-containing protein YvlB
MLLVLAFFVTGCGSSIDRAVEQTIEQTHEIEPTGTFSIRNAVGAVRIHGSDAAEMKLKATKKAWSTNQLKGIELRVSAQPGSVSIETTLPPQKTWGFSDRSGTVDYAIIIPRTVKISRLEMGNGEVLIDGMRGDIRANLVNGGLTARNCFGNAQLSVANGALDLFYERWEQRRFAVDARIISGNARAFLPDKASFHVVAETVNGNVANHFAPLEERHPRRASKINMSIGPEPHSDISIRATDGDIEIATAKSE